MKPLLPCAALLTIGLFSSAASAAAAQYTITPIVPAAGDRPTADSINNQGAVIGTAFNEDPALGFHAFLYTPDAGYQHLPLLPGFERSWAGAINDAGEIVGTAEHAEPLGGGAVRLTDHGFLYRNGTVTDLAGPNPPRNHWAWGVSNSGYVVGFSGDQYLPYRRLGDTVTELSRFQMGPELHFTVSVNDAGDVAGHAGSRALVYRDGTYIDLGTLGGSSAAPRKMNNSGQVVGGSPDANGVSHAFLYSDGVMRDILGERGITGPSDALGINEAGQVVGSMGPGIATRGFLYDDGQVIDLNRLVRPEEGWTVVGGLDINDRGQILATVQNAQGLVRAAVLTPVPEPTTMTVLGHGAALLLVRRRRQRFHV